LERRGNRPFDYFPGAGEVSTASRLSERLFLECFQHFFAEMRHESLDSLNMNFAHRTARHDYALAALGNAWRLVNENTEAVLMKCDTNGLSDFCADGSGL